MPKYGALLACSTLLTAGVAAPFQSQTPPTPPSPKDRINAMLNASPGAWSEEQIATMERLRDAALKDEYALTELQHLTNNIGPRISGSPQAEQAVQYVAAEMRALGAEVQLEKTTVPHWVRGAETGELLKWPGQASGTTHKIVLTALGPSTATPPEGLVADVVVVNSFEDCRQLPPGSVKGKILLFNERFDKRLAAQGNGGAAYGGAVIYRGAGPTVAASAGAVAVLVRSVGGADYRLPHTGATFYSGGVPDIPAAAVTAEDADLLEYLTKQGSVQMRLVLTPKTLPRTQSYNVIADWKGSEHPEQVVIVSGHLDSWDLGTGAIDDGAGVTVSMQAIHLLKQLGIHPKRTVRFIAWMDEEQGSDGAQTYVAEHAAEIANHVGALESDLGAGHPGGITFTGNPEIGTWLRPVARVLEPIGAATLEHGEEAGEDINFINSKGVPGFSPTQDSRFYFNYHHTAADTFDKINERELNENAAVMTVLSYALADASEASPH
ncbi:MAG: M20/M25/M40 family metallo-hydrolase [Acidobacteriaceae bacterium]|nr:M20/M25/M40 family metallo-hydrolase [Acidobacteriaceae bacterium]